MIMRLTAPLAAAGLLAACATTTSDAPKGAAKFAEDPRLGEPVKRICFNNSINGFSRNDRDTVVVSARANDNFLIEVRGVCTNLRHAQSIGIDSTTSCVSRNDFLIVSDSAFSSHGSGAGPDRCLAP